MIRCENLSKIFTMHLRDGMKITGFEDINFTLRSGQFLGVSGPSGIGKSSLLKCIFRTYLPTSGRIWYSRKDGSDIDLASVSDHEVINLRNREIGYISQFFHVIPRVSAFDTIMNGLKSRGFNPEDHKEFIEDMLRRLSIGEQLWELFPSTFSGGEKQRINIISAMARRPRLLLLDEPTASLDAATASEVVSLIEELKEQGTAMIGVFHDRALLERLSDSILELNLCPLEPVGV